MKPTRIEYFRQFRQIKFLESAGHLTLFLDPLPDLSELQSLCRNLHAELPGYRNITFITDEGACIYEGIEIPNAFYFFYEGVLAREKAS